jgi:DNA-directed RNA polymerase subunit M/transcription elongation factor TFIIS
MANSVIDTVPNTCESGFSPTENKSKSVGQVSDSPTMNNSAVLSGEVALDDKAAKGEYSENDGSQCPKCGKERVFRSRRKSFLERLRSRFGRYPFRCHACGYRFFKVLKRRRSK